MKKNRPRERRREEMQERPARPRNTSSSAASTRKKAARSARPTGSASHTQQIKGKSARPVSPTQARRNPEARRKKRPRRNFLPTIVTVLLLAVVLCGEGTSYCRRDFPLADRYRHLISIRNSNIRIHLRQLQERLLLLQTSVW